MDSIIEWALTRLGYYRRHRFDDTVCCIAPHCWRMADEEYVLYCRKHADWV